MDNKINEWLKTYEPIMDIAQLEDIHYTTVDKTVKNLALQRTGYEILPLRYIQNKGWYRQYQYMLLLKSESEIDEQRLTNLNWLDDLSDWLVEQNRLRNFPELDGNKKVISVSCANSLDFAEEETSEDGSLRVYSLQLYFNIRKE